MVAELQGVKKVRSAFDKRIDSLHLLQNYSEMKTSTLAIMGRSDDVSDVDAKPTLLNQTCCFGIPIFTFLLLKVCKEFVNYMSMIEITILYKNINALPFFEIKFGLGILMLILNIMVKTLEHFK